MAVNLATKYSNKVDEAVTLASITSTSVNNDYDFVGARTVKVKSFSTAPMNDYTASGSNRYGTPSELNDADQELTLSKRRAFTFTIDKTNAVDSPEGVRDAAKALRRQIDQVVVPEIDTYRISKMALGAGKKDYTTLTTTNAYTLFLAANQAIDEAKYPTMGRVAYLAPDFYNAIKQDSNFVKACDIAQNLLISGQVGEIDGVAIIKAPTSMMTAGLYFVITRKEATTAPIKLAEYKIHQDPPGIAGNLVEGLVYYDAFVLNQQKNAISAQFGKASTLTTAMVAGDSGKGVVTVTGVTNGMTKLVYKTGASQAATTPGTDLTTGWTALPADGIVTATATHKIAIAAVDENNIAIATAPAITVVVGA